MGGRAEQIHAGQITNGSTGISLRAIGREPPSNESTRQLRLWLIDELTVLAEALGQSVTAERLGMYAADLADIEADRLALAFQRARRECRFFPRVVELREFAGVHDISASEALAAWTLLLDFVERYVGNDPYGNFGPQYGWYSTFPRLEERILDAVRVTGGWRAYKCMTSTDWPHQQKRFLDAYASWNEIQSAHRTMLHTKMGNQSQHALPAASSLEFKPETTPEQQSLRSVAKRVPAALSEEERQERRRLLREQAETLLAKRCGHGRGDDAKP